jgi:lipoprotein-anchoring transpeptidase ErfK/SrfK
MNDNITREEINGIISENNKLRTLIKVFIIILLVLLIFLFYFKKNIVDVNFKLNGSDTVVVNVFDEYKEEGATAVIHGVDKTKEIIINSNKVNTNKLGTYKVTYKLKIGILNISKRLTRKVEVVDIQAPEIDVDTESIFLDVNEEMAIPTATAKDNYDGDLTKKIETTNNIDISKIGEYKITYKVVDSSNNKTTKEIKVFVRDHKDNCKIVININEQKLRYYVKGKVVFETDIVSGQNGRTPKGTYSILNKARNVTLVGEDYETVVRYWMPFIGRNYGIHDASWRSRFGGTIYKYNGSHGCVNVSSKAAAELYNMVEIGTPVIIE